MEERLYEEVEQCGICEDRKEKGIHLYNMFICLDCEHNMIHTEPREEKYQYYLQKLKNINKPKLYS
ncbi:sigma factor G inhibitor Gin [Ornithinibacillus halophilus]|uniref:Inhibitor of sigma-G Gin n=1 Tax=Ornithinibacillus halophilus TaxID=930117 RepID=A0A1M5M1C6_9BACI|nr:sigma factor G inhibitor Gin [Ornithinibacillus halophilus]SHG70980.1 Inhibitor of sigma-G Gin [Ornithinibacillus halophilus]